MLQELGLGEAGNGLCDRTEYRKNLLKVVRKMPYIGLFESLRGMNKFEASGMTRWGHRLGRGGMQGVVEGHGWIRTGVGCMHGGEEWSAPSTYAGDTEGAARAWEELWGCRWVVGL
jgi:hypothetical protein